jgi:hypothetical protein
MEEERKGIERDIMTDEELIRKELESRRREIDIMTNFINMKNNASKWIEETKLSINKDNQGMRMKKRERERERKERERKERERKERERKERERRGERKKGREERRGRKKEGEERKKGKKERRGRKKEGEERKKGKKEERRWLVAHQHFICSYDDKQTYTSKYEYTHYYCY